MCVPPSARHPPWQPAPRHPGQLAWVCRWGHAPLWTLEQTTQRGCKCGVGAVGRPAGAKTEAGSFPFLVGREPETTRLVSSPFFSDVATRGEKHAPFVTGGSDPRLGIPL